MGQEYRVRADHYEGAVPQGALPFGGVRFEFGSRSLLAGLQAIAAEGLTAREADRPGYRLPRFRSTRVRPGATR